MKKIFSAILSVLLIFALFACADKPAFEPKGDCSLTVDCHVMSEKADALPEAVSAILPKDGIFLQEKEIAFAEGETAQDLLLRIAKDEKLAVVSANTVYGSYVESIGGLKGGDGGELSGWLYTVNGEFLSVAASEYVLQDGDAVVFVYTCDMGYDVGYTD